MTAGGFEVSQVGAVLLVLEAAVVAALAAALSVVLARRLPRIPLVEAGLLLLVLATAYLLWSERLRWPVASVAVAVVQSAWVLVVTAYPDAREPSRRWWCAAAVAVAAVWLGLVPGLSTVAALGFVGGVLLGLASHVPRFRSASTVRHRQALKWFLSGLFPAVTVLVGPPLVVATTNVPGTVLNEPWYPALCTGAIWWLLATAVAGVVVGERWQVERLLRAAFVAPGVALLCVWAAAVVAPDGLALPGLAAAVGVAFVAARIFGAVATRVVWLGNEDRALRDLGNRLGRAGNPTAVPRELEAALREGLGLDAVVELGATPPARPLPAASRGAQAWPVMYQGRRVATVLVSPRPGELALTARDRTGLAQLLAGAAGALDAAGAHERLRAAHEKLVATREEERRRLRRELHDDLAPTLAGLSLTAAAAADLVGNDPPRAAAVQRELVDGLSRAGQQVREIAYDLRPPVLDDRGLLAALQERVADGAEGPPVRLVGDCSELPAAVGSAALRIVQEAVTNVRRHSGARSCEVVVEQHPDALHVRVIDDGHGFTPDTPLGVGLVAMRERVQEVGGSLEVTSGANGTCVQARLPYAGRPAR